MGFLTHLLAGAGVVCTLIGLLVIVQTLILPMREPADQSNRIAHLRLVWWALTRPERFVGQEPWLAMDELDLVEKAFEKTSD